MSAKKSESKPQTLLKKDDFQKLLDLLSQGGYRIIGPTVDNQVVVYDELSSTEQLPVGWTDQQDGGSYRLVEGKGSTLFGYVVGPQSLKKYLHPAVEIIWEAQRDGNRFVIEEPEADNQKHAFVGVRPCELAALAVQDKVLLEGPYANPGYQQRRREILIIAVNCTRPGGTCFCASMGTGPRATSGFDLALTEVVSKESHYFIVESGSEQGRELLGRLPTSKPSETELLAANKAVAQAADRMGRKLDVEGIKEHLYAGFDSVHWEQVAERCLSCGNCTMVCPTCFCVNVEDTTDISGSHAERKSRWDSCYTVDFSYIHGGSIRNSTMSRYRQWLEHKLAYWQDQFGTFGCVGCGRCITWCPVGIDITEEARAVCENK